jgi:hypothetical protein|tara:strand:+ start:360 stop:644 length:285 start_codon:yes stop_codon:yes gene_type:complete
MFAFDRDTAVLVAVAICVFATMYMYSQHKKTNESIEEFREALADKQKPMVSLERPRPAPWASKIPVEVKKVPIPVVEEKTEKPTPVITESESSE